MIDIDRNDFAIPAVGYMAMATMLLLTVAVDANMLVDSSSKYVVNYIFPILGIALLALGLIATYRANLLDGIVFIILGLMEGISWLYGMNRMDYVVFGIIAIVIAVVAFYEFDYILACMLACVGITNLSYAIIKYASLDMNIGYIIGTVLYAIATICALLTFYNEWMTLREFEEQCLEDMIESPENQQ